MSDFIVQTYEIKVVEHPHADALEIAMINDFRTIVQKGKYKDGDVVAYIPQNAQLPESLVEELGLTGRLGKNNVVRPIRLRKILSEGLVYPMPDRKVGEDVTKELGIVKYEPPIPTTMGGEVWNAAGKTLKFDIENIKKYPNVFQPEDQVVVTEKAHGTFALFGIYEDEAIVSSKGLSGKGLAFKLESSDNVYTQAYNKYKAKLFRLRDILGAKRLYVLGEIFGKGIQDMNYGYDKHQFRVFDIWAHDGFTSFRDLQDICSMVNFPMVPVVHVGNFDINLVKAEAETPSLIGGNLREGVVVKSLEEEIDDEIGRKMLKVINPAYLTRKNGTEYN